MRAFARGSTGTAYPIPARASLGWRAGAEIDAIAVMHVFSPTWKGGADERHVGELIDEERR